jgi:TolB-like protein
VEKTDSNLTAHNGQVRPVRSSLERELNVVLASAGFRSSPKLSSLLRHLATSPPEDLKESVIAAEFFGCGGDYDTKIDSQVRTEVRRLRLKLAEYYTGEGQASSNRIEIPKGSYEVLVRPVQQAEPPPPPVLAPEPPTQTASVTGTPLWPVVALLLAVPVLAAVWLTSRPAKPISVHRIAVLPFHVSLPASQAGGAFELIGDDLSDRLSRSRVLRVTSRTSTSAFQGTSDDVKAVGDKLLVDALVQGSAGAGPKGGISISAAIIDARTGGQLWSGRVEGPSDRLGQLEDELSAKLLSAMGLKVPPPPYRAKKEAVEAFVQGSLLLRKPSAESLKQAVVFFEKSAELDPGFVQALASLARTCFVASNNGIISPAIAIPKAEAAAQRALRLDPQSSLAHQSQGNLFYAKHNWDSARAEYLAALEIDPSSASAYFDLAQELTAERRFGEAELNIQQAMQLSPLWYGPQMALTELYYYEGRYDDSFRAAQELSSRFPGVLGSLFAARARFMQGRFEEAGRELGRGASPLPDARRLFSAVYAQRRGEAISLLRQAGADRNRNAGYFPAIILAELFMRVGEREQAIHWLEESMKASEPDLVSLNVDPLFDPIRNDPRCRLILEQLGLRRTDAKNHER